MHIESSRNFKRRLRKLSQANISLAKKIDKQLARLATDINHPSLKLHKVHLPHQEAWSISVDRSIRIIFEYRDNKIQLVDLGPHDEVYLKK